MKGYYGEGIFHFRTIKKVKQDILAHLLTMSRQNLSEIEQNHRKISDEDVEIAAKHLGTSPEEIKSYKGNVVFNNQNQTGEQYNNCQVSVPRPLLDSLQIALKIAHTQINDLQVRLHASEEALTELRAKFAALEADRQQQ